MAFIESQYGWLLLAAFALAWIGLGYYFSLKVETDEDFMVAGRSVGLAMGSATVMATWVTANTVLTAPELGWRAGFWGMIAYSGAGLSLILFGPLAVRIKHLMPDGVTSGDFMRSRYGEKTWGYYMLLTNIYFLAFLVTQAMGGGIVLELIFGIPFQWGMLSVIAVAVTYTLMGGMQSVIGTDFVQTILIFAALIIVVPLAVTQIGLANIYGGVLQNMPSRMNALQPLGLMYAFNGTILAIGEVFHNNLWWTRAHSMREDVIRKGWTYGGIMWMAVPIIAGVSALAAISTGMDIPQLNMIFPLVTSSVIGTTGAVLVSIVIISALFSSMDSLLSAVASLWAEDVYRVKFNPEASSDRMKRINRYIILAAGIITASIAFFQPGTMGQILYFSAAFIVPMVWPIAHGLYSRRASPEAAAAAMLIGPVAGLYTYYTISNFAAAVTAGIVSLIVYFAVIQFRPGDFEWDTLREYSLEDRIDSPDTNTTEGGS